MTIILFVVDNSISMCQKTYLGCSVLDVAKKAVETFLKFRARDMGHRLDRIMLMTFDEFPTHLKVGWRETVMVFQNELKNMAATACSSGSEILSSAFELLNVYRLQSGIDTFGQGRSPFYVESAVVVLLTDGQSFVDKGDITVAVNNRIPGMELTKEPFRWDQRLFTVVLKLPGVRPEEKSTQEDPLSKDIPRDTSVLEGLSSMTGGRSFFVDNIKTVDLVMQRITENMQNGVMARFEPMDTTFPVRSGTFTKMIYLPRNPQKTHALGHWPLPEPYWLDLNPKSSLPPRNAHPILRYKPCMEDVPVLPMIGDVYFPVDKYEVEPSALAHEIIEKSQRFPHWQVYIDAEGPEGPVHQLCGYLTAAQNGPDRVMFLHVLPVDYPRVLDLFDKFNRHPNRKEWKAQFDAYIQSIPVYIAAALKRFLVKITRNNLYTLIPETYDISPEIQNYLRKIKIHNKAIFDSTIAYPGQPFPAPDLVPVIQKTSKYFLNRSTTKQETESGAEPGEITKKDSFEELLSTTLAEQTESQATIFTMHLHPPAVMYQRNHIVLHRNPFDVEREELVSQFRSLKFALLHPERWKGCEEPERNVPVGQMGNYQDYLKNASTPLRDYRDTDDALSTADKKPHFGNPFLNPFGKKSKKGVSANLGGMVDEADVDVSSDEGSPRPKRTMSESRERLSGQSSLKRSRSMSPAPLRPPKPTKPPKEDTTPPETPAPVEIPQPTVSPSPPVSSSSTSMTNGVDSSKKRVPLPAIEIIVREPVVDTIPSPEIIPPISNGPSTSTVTNNGSEKMETETIDENAAIDDLELDLQAVTKLRCRIFKLIRSSGRNFSPVIEILNEALIGVPGKFREKVVGQIILEAERFRRHSLISLLKETYLTAAV